MDALDYEYDVFISYRHHEWKPWVRECFMPSFRRWLRALKDDAKVFFDEDVIPEDVIQGGSNWVPKLATGLAKSRILVPLLSRQYFGTDWCLAEYKHMQGRERGFTKPESRRAKSLIVPAVIHDGEHFPSDVLAMKPVYLKKFISYAQNGKKKEELEQCIKTSLVPNVIQAIRGAPKFDPEWEHRAIDDFEKVQVTATKQNIPPSLGES